jgi:hypothetical protein
VASAEHGGASVDRQAELAINRYAIALDYPTVRPTVNGREMSPVRLYNTRTRAKQTFVPAHPSGEVGLSAGQRSTTSRNGEAAGP